MSLNMADIHEIKKSKGYKNYKSLDAALSILGQSLEQFTVQSVETVHQKVSKKLGLRPQCNKQCSRNILDHKRWCQTCFDWKQELTKFLKKPREQLKWNWMKSWMWPISSEHIREVFVPGDWKLKDINFKDMSTIINVWKRCTEVNAMMVNQIDRLRKLRNAFTHKYGASLYVEDNEMLNDFLIIFNVLAHPDIKAAIPNYNEVIKTLKELEQFGMETDVEKALCQIQTTLSRILEENQTKKGALDNKTIWTPLFLSILIVIAGIYFAKLDYSSTEQELSRRIDFSNGRAGCLPEDPIPSFAYKYVRMLGYLSHYHSFVGRQWLFENLEKTLQQQKKGVVLIADMGYGKTAAVANIICATSSDTSYNLKKRLIAYHICRFDSVVTKQQFVFIRRLTSLIAKYIPQFHDILKHYVRSCIDIFDTDTCEKDPYGCFEECLVNPLRKTPDPGDFKLIIIDALDECEHNRGSSKYESNGIASLLKFKIHLLPTWLKFLVTCRDDLFCQQLKSSMNVMVLDSSDKRNTEDIKTYLNSNRVSKIEGKIESTTFLLVTSAVETNTFTEQFPSMKIFYEYQFKRYFSSGFKHVKAILEIIFSALNPVNKQELWYILSNTTDIDHDEYDDYIRLLNNFVKFIDDEAHILHISIKEWLLDTENSEFKINPNAGHYYNAQYLLKLLQDYHCNIDIVKLVLHAVKAIHYKRSNMLQILSSMISKNVKEVNKFKNDYPLHIMAKYADSADAMKYLLKHFPDANMLNNQNVTPAFIAASTGHLDTLKSLINAGADTGFRTQSFQDIINLDIAVQISFEKMHWNYGLLDIAVQNGHFKMVEFILGGKIPSKYPLRIRNGMNLLPIHLGCKLGHVQIVQHLHHLYPWMLDNTCLYFAAEGGHADLVLFIMKTNISDDCKPCDSKLHWIPRGKIRIQSQVIDSRVTHERQNTYVLFDDWHFITCETALHVAVRLRYIQVVNVLLSYSHGHKCSDRGGRIPLMSAIQYNYSDIVSIFIERNLFRSDLRCLKSPESSRLSQLNDKERLILKLYICPNNFSIMHMVSKYDRSWIFDMLPEENKVTNWKMYDNEGCLPVHVAACHGSLKMLTHYIQTYRKQLENMKCKNGKSPIESAIECASFTATKLLLSYQLDFFDNLSRRNKRAVILSALRKQLTSSLAWDDYDKESNTSKIVQLVLVTEEDMRILYEKKRNILHLALLNGHFQVVIDTFSNYPGISAQLMRDKDDDLLTPLKLAVLNLEKSTEFIFNFLLNLTMGSSKSFLTSKEYSILIALEFVEKNKLMSLMELRYILYDIISKNHCSLISLYVNLVNIQILQDDNFFGNVLRLDYTSILTYEMYVRRVLNTPSTPFDILKCSNNCTELMSKCHLHSLALKYGQLLSALTQLLGETISENLEESLTLYFRKISNIYTSCYDSDGFNILERAIQGWSSGLVKHLTEIGVRSKLSANDLILLATNIKYRMRYEKYYILTRPYKNVSTIVKLINKNYVREGVVHAFKQSYDKVSSILVEILRNFKYISFQGIPRKYTDLDLVVSTLIRQEHTNLSESLFCSQDNTQRLSLVHVFAMHDMTLSLANISIFWGKDVLSCRNFHSITPMYLATNLRQESTRAFLFKNSIKDVYPQQVEEEQFVSHFLMRFLFKIFENENLKCIFRYKRHMPRNMYTILRAYRCFTKVTKIIGEDDYSRGRLKFIKSSYKLLQVRDMCKYSGVRKLQKKISPQKFKVFMKELGNEMISVYEYFLFTIEYVKKFDAYSIAKEYLLANIKDIKDNPVGIDGLPIFCGYHVSQNWGFLRNTFRFTVENLRLRITNEIVHIVRNTLFFSDKFSSVNELAHSLRIIPAFTYVNKIDNLPFFEDTYLLFLKAIRTGDRPSFIEQTTNWLLYRQWSENAETIRNDFFK